MSKLTLSSGQSHWPLYIAINIYNIDKWNLKFSKVLNNIYNLQHAYKKRNDSNIQSFNS